MTDPSTREGAPERSVLRKAAITAAGGSLTAVGVIMLVTPGPGILVTAAGLGLLSQEYPSIRRLFDRVRRRRDEAPDDTE